MSYVFSPPPQAHLDVTGSGEKFPVRRVYCIGKNYLAHIHEMGSDERDPPVIFQKPADAVVPNGGELPYPIFTNNLHYEVELVVALKSGGYNIPVEEAASHIYGYAVGLDMTRRDHQAAAMAKGMPWEVTKAFDQSAPIGPVTPVEASGVLENARLVLKVNGEVKQDADISLMIWKVNEIIVKISEQHRLMPGDIIMTGTPAGVGAVTTGDELLCELEGVEPLRVRIGGPAA